ncbi:hypothetical protein ACLEE6_06840 [Lonsdalea quercina]|uniref:hypothetical protein n=1 Tax=Lonsdalea quercina TaxID=71657 RepID=UPI0039748D23
MKNIVLFFVLIGFSSISHAESESFIGCFKSKNINVKFVQINRDDTSLAYVKYQKSNKAIPLLFVESAYEKNEEGGVGEYTTKWDEFVKGKLNGQYTVMSQGARFYQLRYISNKNSVTYFEDDITLYNEDGTNCKW